jgi:hypothetical protein
VLFAELRAAFKIVGDHVVKKKVMHGLCPFTRVCGRKWEYPGIMDRILSPSPTAIS